MGIIAGRRQHHFRYGSGWRWLRCLLSLRRNLVISLPDSVPASVSRSFVADPRFHHPLHHGEWWRRAGALGAPTSTRSSWTAFRRRWPRWAAVVGLTLLFSSLLWFFGVHGSMALAALDSGIMTPFALENVELYNP